MVGIFFVFLLFLLKSLAEIKQRERKKTTSDETCSSSRELESLFSSPSNIKGEKKEGSASVVSSTSSPFVLCGHQRGDCASSSFQMYFELGFVRVGAGGSQREFAELELKIDRRRRSGEVTMRW